MKNWSPLNGNPAPGGPFLIRSYGVDECNRIADEAGNALNELERIRSEFSSSIWVGEAARKFSEKLPTTIDDLKLLRRGYREVAGALDTFAASLVDLQGEADATLALATKAETSINTGKIQLEQAEHLRSQLSHARDTAEAQVQTRAAALNHLTKQRLSLQQKRAQTTDAAQALSLDQMIIQIEGQLRVATSHHRDALNRLVLAEQNLNDANSGVKTASTKLTEATAQLRSARDVASHIGNQFDTQAKRAAITIREAKGTAVGTWAEKQIHKVKNSPQFQAILNTVDKISEIMGTTAFALKALGLLAIKAGIITSLGGLTFGAGITLGSLIGIVGGVALVLGVAVLVVNFAIGRQGAVGNIFDAAKLTLSILTMKSPSPVKTFVSALGPIKTIFKNRSVLIEGVKSIQAGATAQLNTFKKTVTATATKSVKNVVSVAEEGGKLIYKSGKVIQKVITSSAPWSLPKLLW